MKKIFLILSAFLVTSCQNQEVVTVEEPIETQSQQEEVKVQYNINEPIKLKNDIGQVSKINSCYSISDLNKENTPLDLMFSATNCIQEENYDNAAELFSLASAYSYFDNFRISDTKMQSTFDNLSQTMIYEFEEDKLNNLSASLKSIGEDAQRHSNFCNNVLKLGYPKYIPRYMASPGEYFSDSMVNESFNKTEAWNIILRDYLKCNPNQ